MNEFQELASWLPYACIAAVFGYIIALQLGLGPIPYFIGTGSLKHYAFKVIINPRIFDFLAKELFESAPRPAAMSLGSLSLWTCNFIVGMAFPSLLELWGAFIFLAFAVVCFTLAVFLKFYLPETRGRNSSDIAPLVADGFKSKPFHS